MTLALPEKPISAKEAAQIAAKYYQDVTSDYNPVSVAEVELSEDASFWLITLLHRVQSNPFAGFDDKWGYKTFKVSAKTGDVLSMKIKKV